MALTNSTNNDLQFANQPAAGRWTATPEPGAAPVTENVPEGVPKAAVVTWAAGSRAAPNGRNGKKMRRRTRKIAAALATIFVMSTIGTTTAVAQTSFYKASPYVDNKELVEAGSKSFDERLAIGEPESTPSAPVAASNLENAILTGGLSPGKMEMPDMMLAGISGDEMALAAAADDSNPASDSAAAQPNQSGQAGQPGKGAPKDAGGNAGGDSTVGDLAKSAADENPDGYASPALGGDPEPIMDEYAQDEGGPGGEPDAGQDPVPQTPANVELAGADTGADTGTDAGAEAPIEPTASEDGSHPEDGGPDETQPQSDELAVIPPPASDKSGSEEESYQTPPDPSGPTGVAPEEPSTDEPSTEEPSEVEGPRTTDQAPDDEPDGAPEQAFADPSYTEKDDEEPLADEQPTSQPSTADPSTADPPQDVGSEEDGGSSELAATPPLDPSEGDPIPEDTEPMEDDDPSTDPAATLPDDGLSDQTPSEVGSEDKGYEEETKPEEGTDPDQGMYPEEGTDPEQGTDPEEGTNPGEGANPEEDLAASTASINQSSSVQVFADEGSSAEVEATQVAAINTDGELDRNSLSDSSGQSEDGGPEPETNGELAATDKGVGDEEQTVAEPAANEDTPPGAEEPSVPHEGQQPGPVAQGDPKDVSQPTAEEPQPADENGQNSETPPPAGTQPEATQPEATQPEESAQEPQAIDNENQQGGTSQNTTPQSGDPQEEPSNAEPTSAEGSSPQDTPSQGATTPAQPGGRQPNPAQQQADSGPTGPGNPSGQRPDARQDSTDRTQHTDDANPTPAAQKTPRTHGSPNVRKSALPSQEDRELSDPQRTRPGNPGGQSVPQQQAPQQQVEEQSFAEPDPADGAIGEQDPSTPADPPVDEPAEGAAAGLPADVAEGANWTEQTEAPSNQQAVLQGQRAARQAVRAQRTAARQAAVPQAGVAGQGSQGYVEPAVEPTAAPAAEQSWEQPVQQTGVDPYAQPTAEPSATPDQASISKDAYESVEGAAGEAPDTYVDEMSIGTGTVPDSNTYNNPYAAGDTSESYEDPVTAPVDNTYAAPAAAETNPAQDTAIPATAPGYEAQDTSNYAGVQETAPAESEPAYGQETQEVSTQVPTQEFEPAPQVAAQELEPAPQVTNTLVDETSAAPSVGTSQVASPATSGGEAPSTAGTKVQNTTSAITGGGQK